MKRMAKNRLRQREAIELAKEQKTLKDNKKAKCMHLQSSLMLVKM